MKIEKLKKLAEQKADSQERRGTRTWNGMYYGFIYGWQACEKNVKEVLTAYENPPNSKEIG
jgi:hypothetical protein